MTRVPESADHIRQEQQEVNPGSVESLYPFLYRGDTDIEAVLVQARASTIAKVHEAVALRAEVCARSSDMLAVCAKQAAARFSAGGRLRSSFRSYRGELIGGAGPAARRAVVGRTSGRSPPDTPRPYGVTAALLTPGPSTR
jgi:hypothetical protein